MYMYTISIIVSKNERSVVGKRKKRAVSTTTSINLNFRSYKCFYENCVVPPDPSTLPPPNTRPADAIFWSNTSTWPNNTLPVNGDSVTIEEGNFEIIIPHLLLITFCFSYLDYFVQILAY